MTLLIPLCFAALALAPSASSDDRARALVVCNAADRVVHAREPLFHGSLGRLRTGLLLISIAKHESKFRVDAFNPDGGDTGLGQVRRGRAWGTYTQEQILSSADIGLEVTLNAARFAQAACGGGASRWLSIYASGRCLPAMSIARELCEPLWLVGGCAW